MLTLFGWNKENMFFLTRDYPLEPITTVERLKHCADQVLSPSDVQLPEGELDRFGRNYLDRMFVALCMNLDVFFVYTKAKFKSLLCEKLDGKYMMRLLYDDEDITMELVEMVYYFREKRETR